MRVGNIMNDNTQIHGCWFMEMQWFEEENIWEHVYKYWEFILDMANLDLEDSKGRSQGDSCLYE